MTSRKGFKDIALFDGEPLFDSPIGEPGLVKPDIETFLNYSKLFFESGQFTNNGLLVCELEKKLANFHESRYCVTFSSGFWALVLAIEVLKLPDKSEVIIPSLSYSLLADIVLWCGMKPRFCDVEEKTLAISAKTVGTVITSETALIIGVHPIVNCLDVSELRHFSEERGIPLILDSVESAYERTSEGRIGSMAKAEMFSLNASKLINGGEGGYVITSCSEIYEGLKRKRNFGFEGLDRINMPGGINAKLNEMHAGMALTSLNSLENTVKHNKEIYYIYKREFSNLTGLKILEFNEEYRTSYMKVVIEVTDVWPFTRDFTINALDAENILSAAYYCPALHQRHLKYSNFSGKLPNTEKLFKQFILMPSGSTVMPKDIHIIREFLQFLLLNADDLISTKEEASYGS